MKGVEHAVPMLVAVSALDVALVGGIAALVSAVVSPLSAWFTAKQTHQAETERARAERVYDDRVEVYTETLRLVNICLDGAIWVEYTLTGKHDLRGDMPTLPTKDDLNSLFARLDVIGSSQMAAEFEWLTRAFRKMGALTRNMMAAETLTEEMATESIGLTIVIRESKARMADLARRELGHDKTPNPDAQMDQVTPPSEIYSKKSEG